MTDTAKPPTPEHPNATLRRIADAMERTTRVNEMVVELAWEAGYARACLDAHHGTATPNPFRRA